VLSTTVPETAVHENRNSKSFKHNIGSSWKSDTAVEAISIAHPMERKPKGNFGSCT
jgi:hypothetical protein